MCTRLCLFFCLYWKLKKKVLAYVWKTYIMLFACAHFWLHIRNYARFIKSIITDVERLLS